MLAHFLYVGFKLTRHRPLQGYRPDIDGLRAIAVTSVILYHINQALIPGGFVGVDIFFVLSGYLITLHILKDMELEQFSLVEFYRKRVKRIFPVMLVVVGITLLCSLLILRPDDSVKVAYSGFASLFSMANVYFWLFLDTSYFAASSSEVPLLHLWSLGVEEQFYIFWPLLLMLIYRRVTGQLFVIALISMTLISFWLGEYLFSSHSSFVYYMLPSRAGELLIGALSAYIVLKQGARVIPKNIIAMAAVFGFVCVCSSLFLLSEGQVFPGWRAVLPTLGTALLILSGHYGRSMPSRLLELRPLVWIGLISYSAYLWHWPLLAFFRYAGLDMTLLNGIAIITLTLVLAWLSYRYIERPTRRYNGSALKVLAFQFVVPASVLLALSVMIMKTGGYFLHWNAEQYRVAADKVLPAYKHNYVCQSWVVDPKQLKGSDCIVGSGNAQAPSVLLWGDSNAAHYIGMLGVFSREGRFQLKNLEHSSCPPILNADPERFIPAQRLAECKASLSVMPQVLDAFDTVIVSANWSGYQQQSNDFISEFFSTVTQLVKQGKLVILIGKAPIISTYDRLCPEKAINLPFMECTTASSMPIGDEVKRTNILLKNFALKTSNVEYYDIENYLCPNGACTAFNMNGEPMYYDTHHLSLPASWLIGEEIYRDVGVPYPFTLIGDYSVP